jgi:uncharacterized protein (DUF58 family)
MSTIQGELDTVDALNTRQFIIAIKKLANTLSYGTDRSPFLGSGIEYVQSRPYQPGDSIRSIDWRITARTGKYFVKEFEAPKRLPVYVLLDTSASMTISSTHKSKYAMAVHIAGGLGLACLERVSPVGLIGVGSREVRVEPSLAAGQVMKWLHLLRKYRYDESTQLGRKITQLAPTLASRSLIFALSDLHDPTALPSLKLLAQNHDCAVIQLRDPVERGVSGAGLIAAREPETGRTFITRGKKLKIDDAEIARDLKRAGIDHLCIDTDQPFVANLRNFLKGRNLLGRGAR